MIRVLFAAVLLLAAPAADAQGRKPPRSIGEEVDRCPDQTNLGIANCAGVARDREDARLNRAYKAAMARLKPARQASLRAAQRQWIKDRDRAGREEYDMGGAQAPIYAAVRQAEMTRDRAQELEKLRK